MDQYRSHPLYRKHNLDSVMSSLWEFYKSHFLSLFLISLVMSGIIQYASTMINMSELQSVTDPSLLFEKIREMMVPILIVSLISIFLTTILQHYIIFKPIDSSNNIFKSVLIALKYYIPFLVILIFLSFFGAFAITIGVLALIIGAFFAALYIFSLYLMILPVMMIENRNIGVTVGRVFSLLHRNFWSNLGWVAVFTIILIVINVVLSAIVMIPFSGNMLKTIFNPEAVKPDFMTSPAFIILSAVVSAVTLPLVPVFACILYFNAKAGEDDIQIQAEQPREYIPRVEDLYSRPLDEANDQKPEESNT
jgi:hypothetical protein